MKQKLFQYAVLWHPKEKKAGESSLPEEKSKIVCEPTIVLAADEKSVGILAAKKIPDEYNDQLDQIEVLVRPF
jgi:hypothetical protein